MGFVRESFQKHANPFESSANPPANPLDFSPQQLRFLVRAGPTRGTNMLIPIVIHV